MLLTAMPALVALVATTLALPSLTDSSDEARAKGRRCNEIGADDDDNDDGADLMWTLAGLVSVVPYLSWASFLLLALEDGGGDGGESAERTRRVLTAAALALPWLVAGPEGALEDSACWLALAAGVAAVQLERVASTEGGSGWLAPRPRPPGSRVSAEALGELEDGRGREGRSGALERLLRGDGDGDRASDILDAAERAELESFDRQLRQRGRARGEADGWD